MECVNQSDTLLVVKISDIVSVGALGALLLAGAANLARGKQDVVVEGVAVQQDLRYEFYPDSKDCVIKGSSYLLLPNKEFSNVVSERGDINSLQLLRSVWKLKVRGDLSRIGRFGAEGRNLREFKVRYVIDARQLECGSGWRGIVSQIAPE